MPGRATKAPAAPVSKVTITSDAGAEKANGKKGKIQAPLAAPDHEPIATSPDRVMTRAAAQQDLESRLKLQEALAAEGKAAKASRNLYKSAFNLLAGSVLAALKGGEAATETKGLQAASMEQAVKSSSKLLTMKDLQGCELKGKDLAAQITRVCSLVPDILDSMSGESVIEVQRLIGPIIEGQTTWEKVNHHVSEKCRRDERGVPGLCDLVDALCAKAGAEHEFQYVKKAALAVVAVLLSS